MSEKCMQEVINLLNLSIAQISAAVADSDRSVDDLVDSFVQLVKYIESVVLTLKREHPDSFEVNALEDKVDLIMQEITDRVNQGIVAFQFYDRLTQHIEHVVHGLKILSNAVDDGAGSMESAQWQLLQRSIKSKYTMEAERKLFDAIVSGKNIDEALAIYPTWQQQAHRVQEGGVELF